MHGLTNVQCVQNYRLFLTKIISLFETLAREWRQSQTMSTYSMVFKKWTRNSNIETRSFCT